jgi:DNA-directed RNA polymerase subunit beta'
MPTSVGEFLINDVLPVGLKISGPVTKKSLHDHVVGLAKSDPAKYVEVISALKHRGDEIATLEGISVGLDDITPDKTARDAIMRPLERAVAREADPVKREKLVIEAQTKLLDLTKRHPGSMTAMALSGARGNVPQLMKIVATPLAANSEKKGIDPWLIKRSYAEGLTPSEYWVTTPEARANNVATVVSVSAPGEMTKVLVANMISKLVTETDCGTHNGVTMRADDPQCLDRYLASDQKAGARNTLVTPQVVQGWKRAGLVDVVVRSPMTCASNRGVCQHCQGLDEKGHLHGIGSAIGVRSAQAMSEPLTQMALSSKHAVLTIKERKLEPQGFKGVRQLLEIPKNFRHEAVLAPTSGTVGAVEAAPQGGHFVHVGAAKLYAAPELTVTVKSGAAVEAGDALTDGVPHPAKVVGLKGLGAGRRYFVDALHRVYAGEGVVLDKRHLELLAKSELNHVRLLEADPEHPEFLKGDTLDYNAFREAYTKDTAHLPIDEAAGRHLGQELFHHTVGTELTPRLVSELKARGVHDVAVVKRLPSVQFVMKPFAMNPLQDPDWMGRLAHRYLKGSIERAAHFGETSDVHGTHAVPAYAYGAEFGTKRDGSY